MPAAPSGGSRLWAPGKEARGTTPASSRIAGQSGSRRMSRPSTSVAAGIPVSPSLSSTSARCGSTRRGPRSPSTTWNAPANATARTSGGSRRRRARRSLTIAWRDPMSRRGAIRRTQRHPRRIVACRRATAGTAPEPNPAGRPSTRTRGPVADRSRARAATTSSGRSAGTATSSNAPPDRIPASTLRHSSSSLTSHRTAMRTRIHHDTPSMSKASGRRARAAHSSRSRSNSETRSRSRRMGPVSEVIGTGPAPARSGSHQGSSTTTMAALGSTRPGSSANWSRRRLTGPSPRSRHRRSGRRRRRRGNGPRGTVRGRRVAAPPGWP